MVAPQLTMYTHTDQVVGEAAGQIQAPSSEPKQGCQAGRDQRHLRREPVVSTKRSRRSQPTPRLPASPPLSTHSPLVSITAFLLHVGPISDDGGAPGCGTGTMKMICSMYRAAPGTPGMSATGFEERTYKLALMRINSEEPSFLCLGQHNHVDVGHLWLAAPPWSFICAYFTNSPHASSPQSRADRTARRARAQQELFAKRRRRLGHAGSTWPTTRVQSRPTLARMSRFLHPPFPSSQSPLSFFVWQLLLWHAS